MKRLCEDCEDWYRPKIIYYSFSNVICSACIQEEFLRIGNSIMKNYAL